MESIARRAFAAYVNPLAALFIVAGLGATAHADPIRLVPDSVTASSEYPGSPASNVVDGKYSTSWNSGAADPGWIELDFGKPISAWSIRLRVSQWPAGNTTHRIYAGNAPNPSSLVDEFERYTRSGQWLEYALDGLSGVRYIRIETVDSPSWVAWYEIEVYQGVEYFGYFSSDVNSHAHLDDILENGANLGWIADGTSEAVVAKLEYAYARGAKAVVAPGWLVWQGGLRSDWRQRWQELASTIDASPDAKSALAAFYLRDEPYHRGYPVSTMREWLAELSEEIRSYTPDGQSYPFSNTPQAMILAYTSLFSKGLESADISMVDWIGLNCYGPWENCGGRSMDSYIQRLNDLTSETQRLIAVPWAFRWEYEPDDINAQNEMIQHNINQWHDAVLKDGRYVAIVPFLWDSRDLEDDGDDEETGTADMPWVKERLRQLAGSFLDPAASRIHPLCTIASGSPGYSYPFAATFGPYVWNSGSMPWEYIRFTLPGGTFPCEVSPGPLVSNRVRKIELVVAQSPPGVTEHDLFGFGSDGSIIHLGKFYGDTHDGQVLSWTGNEDITDLIVMTRTSPSWVAWKEIRVFRVMPVK